MTLKDWIPIIIQVVLSITTLAGIVLSLKKTNADASKSLAEADSIRDKSNVDTAQGFITAAKSVVELKDKTIESLTTQLKDQRTLLEEMEKDRDREHAERQMDLGQIKLLQDLNKRLTLKISNPVGEEISE